MLLEGSNPRKERREGVSNAKKSKVKTWRWGRDCSRGQVSRYAIKRTIPFRGKKERVLRPTACTEEVPFQSSLRKGERGGTKSIKKGLCTPVE